MARTSSKANGARVRETLRSLSAMASQEQPKPPKKPEWELPLDAQGRASAEAWVNAKTVFDPVKAVEETTKRSFNEYAMRALAEKLLADKSKPANPSVVIRKSDGSVDHKFIWICTESVRSEMPIASFQSAEAEAIALLIDKGLTPANAARLVSEELDFSPSLKIRPIGELLNGHFSDKGDWVDATAEERSAGNKIVELLLWTSGSAPEPLTPDEKRVALSQAPAVTVKSGFVDRVADYCSTVDQVLGVFQLLIPKYYPAHMKFAVSDGVASQSGRRISAASEILTV